MLGFTSTWFSTRGLQASRMYLGLPDSLDAGVAILKRVYHDWCPQLCICTALNFGIYISGLENEQLPSLELGKEATALNNVKGMRMY